MNPETDYYLVLGVSGHATTEEIKTAYRRMCLIWSTDRPEQSDNSQAHERMVAINEAKEVLLDPVARRRYDEMRSEPPRSGPSHDATTHGDCRPSPDVSTVDFGTLRHDSPVATRSVSVRPSPPESWPDGLIVDLSPKSGSFWRSSGFGRPDPDVVVEYLFESTIAGDLKPGTHSETARISFGDATANINFRVEVLASTARADETFASSSDATSVPPPLPKHWRSPTHSPRPGLATALVLLSFGSLGLPFFIMYLALGRHTSGTTGAASILGIPCFALLAFILVKVIPSAFKKAKELWK
jgi:curved DNA-binding protein CbpA